MLRVTTRHITLIFGMRVQHGKGYIYSVNNHSCINTYEYSCFKPLSNKTKFIFKSLS